MSVSTKRRRTPNMVEVDGKLESARAYLDVVYPGYITRFAAWKRNLFSDDDPNGDALMPV